jgi:hypothetical protein
MTNHDHRILADIEHIQRVRAQLLAKIDAGLDLLARDIPKVIALRGEFDALLGQCDVVEADLKSMLTEPYTK